MNKVIIVTGSSRGIGAEIVRQYAGTVQIISIQRLVASNLPEIKKTDYGYSVTGEITLPDTWRMIKEFVEEKKLNVIKIYFNAGVNVKDGQGGAQLISNFEKNLNINFYSVFTAIKVLGADFSEKYIYISSMSTIFPNNGNIGYSLSKTCAEILFASLRETAETSQFQICVLGPINTEFTADLAQSASFLKKFLFKLLVMEPEQCAKEIIAGADTSKYVVYLPLKSLMIYRMLQILRIFSGKAKIFSFPKYLRNNVRI
jgi:short-subunit dehydrogenase